ncbi:MAG: hypothetical protein ILP16_02585 [Spirochaetales bacterium]|nr:hypothetical protein [Spirochaetales bacterium]
MGKKTKKGKAAIIILSVIIIAAAAAAAVYFLAFDTLTVVSDSAFSQVLPKMTTARLRAAYALKGVRLRMTRLSDDCFRSRELFSAYIGRIKSDYVLLGPLSASYAVSSDINVSDLLPSSAVLAIHGSNGSDLFDCTLVSDVESGWRKAATELSSETSTMSQNVGLVYDNDSKSMAEVIISCFPAGHVTEFDKSSTGRLFASTSLDQMNKLGIVIAMCPSVSSFNDFFSSDNSVSWITDYRLAPAVPEKNLYGIVVPDFYGILETAKGVEKGSHSISVLEYVYEKK